MVDQYSKFNQSKSKNHSYRDKCYLCILYMTVINQHSVGKLNKDIRIYDYLTDVFEQLPSRKSIKKALKKGLVSVNGKHVGSAYWIQENDEIFLHEDVSKSPKAYELDLEVVFEDDYLAVINKPAGLIVSGNQFRTVQNAIVKQLKPSSQIDALNWPKPVHRLDKATSGLLIIAKTGKAIMRLSDAFKNGEVQKSYEALVVGSSLEQGVINVKLEGQEAETSYKKLSEVPSLKNEFISFLRLEPKTGRTHQIRKHLQSIGHSIVGDQLYPPKDGHVFTHKGLFLASVEVSLKHPILGDELEVKINTPQKFLSYLKREERRFKKYHP